MTDFYPPTIYPKAYKLYIYIYIYIYILAFHSFLSLLYICCEYIFFFKYISSLIILSCWDAICLSRYKNSFYPKAYGIVFIDF